VNRELLERAAELHRRHRPYVIATVVWARGPSSGKQGASALIEGDGTMHGWIGGACAEPAVLRQARRVMKDGTASLMYLGPAAELDGHSRDGVVTVPISCSSEGALEVFMEPVLPQPHVVLIGHSPAVMTLAGLLDALDWRVTVVDDAGDGTGFGEKVRIETQLAAMDSIGIDDTTPVVVATQGHYDEAALTAALASNTPYIGLVASHTRAETVLGYLRDQGVTEDDLRRIHTPAGIDLGPIEHREIGVAVLAELVAIKASGGIAGASRDEVAGAETAIDPVCGMTVQIEGARFSTAVDGTEFFFCCPACLASFASAPAEYITAS
jgi:xanthine dehydrogenase accessory factor